MSNSKISALTSATTPLAGTETLPIVQSSATTKVTVANLTAGRAVAARNIVLSNAGGSTTGAVQVTSGDQSTARIRIQNTNGQPWDLVAGTPGVNNQGFGIYDNTAAATRMYFGTTGDVTVNSGNLVQGTAAKGFNFTANTPLAGKTSTLLNWYEEGTWTPNQGGGLTLVGAFSSTGTYTRIGRQISVSGTVTGATSVAVTAAGVITTNLPFTVVSAGHGDATNVAINASAAVICTGTSVTSAAAIAATATITFSATYFV